MPDRRGRRREPPAAPDVALRRAGPSDAEAIRRLVHAAYGHYTTLLGRTPTPMLTDYDAAVRDDEVWVLEQPGGGLVGVVVLIEHADHLWIDNVAVDPGAQGRGLGRRLLAFADDEARRRRLPELGLLTNERYVANIAMYERYGYRETHRTHHLGTDLVHFRKPTPA